MRHIALGKHKPDASWLAKADHLLEQLRHAPDCAALNKIIDDNSAVWGDLKQWLLALSHGKCWFSEAKDCFSHWDLEHYRPKKFAKDANGAAREGYWWLAFDWKNLRICGNVGNRKKGTFFPLRPGCDRIAPFGDVRQEDPQLLDPIDEHDPLLLSFNLEGRAVPAPHITDEWEKELSNIRYRGIISTFLHSWTSVKQSGLNVGVESKSIWLSWQRITATTQTGSHEIDTNRRLATSAISCMKITSFLRSLARAC